jgi:hypothetical protein
MEKRLVENKRLRTSLQLERAELVNLANELAAQKKKT